MTNILVTGGAGYIGSHACKALFAAGYSPVAYDNLVHGHEWAVQWGALERGDILDADRLRQVLEQYRPAAVIHFAAYAYVGESVQDPAKYYRNNVLGTLSLLEAMRASDVHQVVFSSTCATYGVPAISPVTEAVRQDPINPYGASKLMIERILADYGHAYGLRHISLRYFNAAGADPDIQIGEAHDPETHLIPLTLDAAAGRRPSITVFGDDYDTRDGTCVRDYIHVSDLADAHVLALQALGGGAARPAYNLGTGTGYSVAEIIAAAELVTQRRIPTLQGPRRAGDPATLVADASAARHELGWTPKYDLEAMVRTAWRWHEKCSAAGKLERSAT